MIEVKVEETANPKEWNAFVASVPEGTIFQTTYWADYMKKYIKEDPIFLVARKGDEIKIAW